MEDDNLKHEYIHQVMSNKTWFAFSHNVDIKQHLFITYLYADDFVHLSPFSILGNNKNETFKISNSAIKVFQFNHEEANLRIIFHALQQKADAAVCSKDTDVLVLLVFAYVLGKINEK